MEQNLIVRCDGGARGNPGPAGVGFVVFSPDGSILVKGARFVGRKTNNEAEYLSVIESLKWLIKNTDKVRGIKKIKIMMDSQLVVNQLNGIFKIKKSELMVLSLKVRSLENCLKTEIIYHYNPRENNKIADGLVNEILDKKFIRKV